MLLYVGMVIAIKESMMARLNNNINKGETMTIEAILESMDGKTFHSESFGGETVTYDHSNMTVTGKSGKMDMLASEQDAKDLIDDCRA